MRSSGSFVAAGFDALPARVAIFDTAGEIVYTNESWESFGVEQGLAEEADGVGTNYLEFCEASDDPDAVATAAPASASRSFGRSPRPTAGRCR